MYQIIKNVIERGGYDLSAILTKIDTLWVNGSLTDKQRTELIGLARSNGDAEYSADVIAKLNDLETRVRAIENAAVTDPAEPMDEYPEYVAGKWYYNGDKCSFENENYICIAPAGEVCVWSPTEYPAYWQKQTNKNN